MNKEEIIYNSDMSITINEKLKQLELEEGSKPQIEIKVYKRRWLMLALFCFVAAPMAEQWIQYSIINNIIMKYYNTTSLAVDFTSMIFMITYIPLVYPAFYIINKKGLRFTTILAAFLMALGSWIKVASVASDRFYVTFIGQFMASVSQIFLLSIPAQLASTWFDSSQVSTACSIGVFGILFGTAFGFVITPIIVQNHDNLDDIGDDLYKMFLVQAAFTTIVLLAVIAFFEKQPPLPPTNAQALLLNQSYSWDELTKTFKRLFTNRGYILLFISFGMCTGVYNAISTLLNQLVLVHFPNREEFAGAVGLLMTLAGMVGSVIFGYMLDKTRKYKEFTVFVYIMSAVGMAVYYLSLVWKNEIFVYITSGIFGAFMVGYIPVGYELCAELTYPEPESITSGYLLIGGQILGVLFTLVFGWTINSFGDIWANVGMGVFLIIGTILTIITPNARKRQDALNTSYQYTIANSIELNEK